MFSVLISYLPIYVQTQSLAIALSAASPDPTAILVCAVGADAKEGRQSFDLLDELSGHDRPVIALDWSSARDPEEGRIVSIGADCNSFVWLYHKTDDKRNSGRSGSWSRTVAILGVSLTPMCCVWNKSGTRFAVATGGDRTVAICHYDPDHRWWASRHFGRKGNGRARSSVTCLAWHPGTRAIAWGGCDCVCRVSSVAEERIGEDSDPSVSLPFQEELRCVPLMFLSWGGCERAHI